MNGLNRLQIMGYLGGDPELRYGQSGKAALNFSVATSESWTDKRSGEVKERTEWHRVVIFDKFAEAMAKILQKGSLVYCEGPLRTEKWTDKEGVDRYTSKLYATHLQLGSRGGGQRQDRRDEPGNMDPAPSRGEASRSQSAPRTATTDPGDAAGGFAGGYGEDDIPF